MTGIRRRIPLLLLLLADWSVGPAGHAAPGEAAIVPAPVTVYLQASAVIEGEQFSLGRIAAVFSPDEALAEEIRKLPMGPMPSWPTLLPAGMIRQRMAPVAADAVVVGTRVALLPGASIPKDQAWFYRQLLAFLDSQDPYKQGRMEIELLASPLLLESGQAAVEGRILFQAAASPYSAGFRRSVSSLSLPAGSMQISYRILASAEGRPQSPEETFRIWIHHFLPVARARRDLPGDYPLNEEDMVFAEEDISLLQSSFFLQGETSGAYKTSAPVGQGELIRGDQLQRLLAVRAGERIVISFTRPGLRVSLPGRALRSGGVGDLITVRPEATAKRFEARITARGEVLVESH